MTYSKEFASTLLGLISSAYTLAETGSCVLPDGFSPAEPIAVKKPVPLLLKHDPLPVWGLSTWFGRQQYIVFRGTKSFPEWVADFCALPLMPHVHCGFHEVFDAVRGQFTIDKDAIIAGHSLGGAIGTLCYSYDGGGQLMTFGCPRVGDSVFSRTLEGTMRIVNNLDIVPHVPLPPVFFHGGTEVLVHGPYSLVDITEAHHLTSYQTAVAKS